MPSPRRQPTDEDPPQRARGRNPILVWALLALGALCCVSMWRTFARGGASPGVQALLVLVAAGVALVPGVSGAVSRALDRVRHPSPAARRRMTVVVWVVASLYLAATAYVHARDLLPRIHDEASYVIQARMLAGGRLWHSPHPAADFFESFHILVRPVYASIYWPGTALMNVPGVWAGLPTWVVPVLLAGLVVALSYRVTAETVDGVAGLLVALLVLSTSRFRTFSTMVMAQVPSALLGLLAVWAYLRWRRERRAGWAAAVGAFAGWGAITRPLDAFAFAAPVGVAMLLDLCRGAVPVAGHMTDVAPRRPAWLQWARTAAAVVGGAAPFLLLQVVFNMGVTGHALRPPYVLYLEQNQPGSVFGSGGAPAAAAAPTAGTQLPQKQIYYADLVQNEAERRSRGTLRWARDRVAQTVALTTPSPLLLVLLAIGLLGWATRRRWALAAAAPLFVGLYLFNPFYLAHYAVPLTPHVAFWAVLGVRVLETASRSPRYRRYMSTFLVLAVVAIGASALPEFNPRVNDEPYRHPMLSLIDESLADVRPPAVVLFRYHPGSNPHEEPVYNADVAWPDDAPIVRAHDLGPRNIEIYRYYAGRDPNTAFYLIDRGDLMRSGAEGLEPRLLGTAGDLVRQYDAAHPPAPAP